MSGHELLYWTENGAPHSACWHSENGQAAPRRVVTADDTMAADAAWRLACEGTALLWRGDYHNARQLLQAVARRAERRPRKGAGKEDGRFPEAFHFHRMAQAQRARTLGMLLIPVEAGGRIALRRAPEVREALAEAFGDEHAVLLDAPFVLSLRELLGLIGAHEWRRKGVMVPALGERIHPWYGVFSPVRGEYLDLVARQPLPAKTLAFDIGTGTGVIAALLARRGVRRVVATDLSPRALGCARGNLARLGLGGQVELAEADLFPAGCAPLIVCNPPWVPAKPGAAVEHAIYDPDSRMLRGFLQGLAAHLEPGGEGWLILSDLAEHLGLRSRDELLGWIAEAGLRILGREDIRPRHAKATAAGDALHTARAAEVTSLWRLGAG
ncbi:methyltransferase [Thauera linaloolentis]|uniref:Methyltransferase n=1 Tax=Thauera linaloolentis (strain DSM 12138 / JCM 21573 / CCUG 41526 / CIP 105981 / IAM 15112 / NBRC 102519 / 47Lol) TaxID=1123367 RepID=N6YSE2_THAL4|nr:class I SAM-dependent methyltransferase [Thauera linaloolentis]ENO85292.1 methyltransferase [Thauera linaloolentis 47Lol = DSM 12138]MCM8563985.1 class I SAM-dependent methyltransferase [Thauera linaloolentis]